MVDIDTLLRLQLQLILLFATGCFFRKKIVGEAFQKGLSDLLMDLILPCNIVASFQLKLTAELIRSGAWVLGISLFVQLTSLLLGFVIYRRSGEEKKSVLRFGTLVSNAAFLGTPVVQGIWGAKGVMLASIFLIPVRIFTWTIGESFYRRDKKNVLLSMLKTPSIDAVLIGIVLLVTQRTLPGALGDAVNTFGRCNTGLSMFLIGMIAAQFSLRDLLNRQILLFTLVRLGLIPLLVLTFCRVFSVDPLSAGISLLLSAMPAGALTAILAEKHGRDTGFATACVAVTTLLSMLTIPLWGLALT